MTDPVTLDVTINGTGFAGDYTARTYGLIPHRNGVDIRLAGVTSGRMENAERFAGSHGVATAFASPAEMPAAVPPTIDNTEPLPLVPAIWTVGGKWRSGLPRCASRASTRLSERSISLGWSLFSLLRTVTLSSDVATA